MHFVTVTPRLQAGLRAIPLCVMIGIVGYGVCRTPANAYRTSRDPDPPER